MTEDVSNSRALIFPLALSALMVLFGATTASLARLDIRPLVAPYFSTAGAVIVGTIVAWLCWAASSKLYVGMTHTLTARLQVA